MSNDNGLVDEYEKIGMQKKELEVKEEKLRKKLIELAKQKNTEILFGTNKLCSIKGYDKVVYPEDKTILLNLIKLKGLYNSLSTLNYFKLSPKIIKKEISQDIIDLTKIEKAFRVILKERGM